MKFNTRLDRSNRPEVFCKKGVHITFAKFTRKHSCRSLFLVKLQTSDLQDYQKLNFDTGA